MISNETFYNYGDYVTELKIKLKHAHNIAYKKLLESKLKQKNIKDKNTYNINVKIGDE